MKTSPTSNCVTLFSFQPVTVVQRLVDDPTFVYTCDTSLSFHLNNMEDDSFLAPYQWMTQQMHTRLTPPQYDAHPTEYPLWAWHTVDGAVGKKPDLRTQMFNGIFDDTALLTLCVDSRRVLLSDFQLWHYVLNNVIIYDEETENALLESQNWLELYDNVTDDDKRTSWEKIFDVNSAAWVQATLWHITGEDIVDVQWVHRQRKGTV